MPDNENVLLGEKLKDFCSGFLFGPLLLVFCQDPSLQCHIGVFKQLIIITHIAFGTFFLFVYLAFIVYFVL